MVEYKEKTIWKCPYCKKEYDNERDAEDCATECADVDSPEEDTKTIYVCQYCKKEYDKEEDAEKCEKNHAEDQDDFYSKERLKQASENPAQKKLI